MVSKIDKIKEMIGDYFDFDGCTYLYFMNEIDEIENNLDGWGDKLKERTS